MNIPPDLIDHGELLRIIFYDENTGVFNWKISKGNNALAGSRCGSRNGHGYEHIEINGSKYKSHRLAWFYIHKEWPIQIDHINGIRSDNRLCNLRNVTHWQNSQNRRKACKHSKTGVLGVSIVESGRYKASIRVGKKTICIGTYDTKEIAYEAYLRAKRKYHEYSTI